MKSINQETITKCQEAEQGKGLGHSSHAPWLLRQRYPCSDSHTLLFSLLITHMESEGVHVSVCVWFLFLYWGTVLSLRCYGLFLIAASGCYSSCGAQACRRGGLFGCRACALDLGLSSWANGLSCLEACGIFLEEIEPVSPALASVLSTSGPPGKPCVCLNSIIQCGVWEHGSVTAYNWGSFIFLTV